MKCPECQHDMVQSKTGWLCLNCGHVQATKPADVPVTPSDVPPTTSEPETSVSSGGVVVTSRPRGKKSDETPAVTPSLADLSVKESRPAPKVEETKAAEPSSTEKSDISTEKAETASETPAASTDVPVEPSESSDVPEPDAAESEVKDEQPASEAAEPAAAAMPEVAAPTLAELSSENHNLQHPAAPELPPVAAPVDAKAEANAPVAATTKGSKAPLVAKTTPQKSSGKTLALIGGAIALLAILAGAYYGFLSPQRPFAAALHLGGTPTPTATVSEASPTDSPAASPSGSPTPTPNVAANNAQRQADLATYAKAYKTAATSGYYNTTPPTVKSDATDPTTAKVYLIITTKPTAVGQIYYWAGGQCGGAGVTPGKASTKFLALEMLLEGDSTPVCLDVK